MVQHDTRARVGTPAGPQRIAAAAVRARSGDAGALHDLYVAFAPAIHAMVWSMLGDEHEAEDVTQNLFARLVPALRRYEPTEVPFSAWIMRVARNEALDQLRRRRRLPVPEAENVEVRADEDSVERSITLRAALDELPQDQRRVVVLRHVLGLTPGEIAELLGKSETAVHGLNHRGRRSLRAGLTRLGSVPQTRPA
jgi:RNA polymerase sigma-70 factor (ECF subfamily)